VFLFAEFILESAWAVQPPLPWQPVSEPIVPEGEQQTVTLSPTNQARYFRLRQQAGVTSFSKSVLNESSLCAVQRRHLARRRAPMMGVAAQRRGVVHAPARSEAKPR